MLSFFPQLLFLAPLAVAILRAVVGLFFLYMAYHVLSHGPSIQKERFPLIGHMPTSLIWIGGTILTAIAALLLVGAWAQVCALLAALGSFKYALYARTYPAVFPFSPSTYFLLGMISLALVFMGPGAFAFALPL